MSHTSSDDRGLRDSQCPRVRKYVSDLHWCGLYGASEGRGEGTLDGTMRQVPQDLTRPLLSVSRRRFVFFRKVAEMWKTYTRRISKVVSFLSWVQRPTGGTRADASRAPARRRKHRRADDGQAPNAGRCTGFLVAVSRRNQLGGMGRKVRPEVRHDDGHRKRPAR